MQSSSAPVVGSKPGTAVQRKGKAHISGPPDLDFCLAALVGGHRARRPNRRSDAAGHHSGPAAVHAPAVSAWKWKAEHHYLRAISGLIFESSRIRFTTRGIQRGLRSGIGGSAWQRR